MPMMDMPLEELRQYRGSSPRPEDFDAYWQRALQELDRQSLGYTLTPSEVSFPGVACGHLWFTGAGGARIHCKFLRPRHIAGKIPALLLFHGYRGHSGDWFDKIPYAAAGMAVIAMDVRGQAGLSQDNGAAGGNTINGHIMRGIGADSPDQLMFRSIFLDAAQLARVVGAMPFVDKERIGAAGHSQGGALTLVAAALEPSIRAIAPGLPFLTDYKRVWEMDYDTNRPPYKEISVHFRLEDPLHEREEEFWRRLGYIDVQNFCGKIRAKTLFFAALMDATCPPSTQFAAFNKIERAPKELVLYRDHGHERLPGADDKTLRFFCEEFGLVPQGEAL